MDKIFIRLKVYNTDAVKFLTVLTYQHKAFKEINRQKIVGIVDFTSVELGPSRLTCVSHHTNPLFALKLWLKTTSKVMCTGWHTHTEIKDMLPTKIFEEWNEQMTATVEQAL